MMGELGTRPEDHVQDVKDAEQKQQDLSDELERIRRANATNEMLAKEANDTRDKTGRLPKEYMPVLGAIERDLEEDKKKLQKVHEEIDSTEFDLEKAELRAKRDYTHNQGAYEDQALEEANTDLAKRGKSPIDRGPNPGEAYERERARRAAERAEMEASIPKDVFPDPL